MCKVRLDRQGGCDCKPGYLTVNEKEAKTTDCASCQSSKVRDMSKGDVDTIILCRAGDE